MKHRARQAEHLTVILVNRLEARPGHHAEAVVADVILANIIGEQFGELKLGVTHGIKLLGIVGIGGLADAPTRESFERGRWISSRLVRASTP